MQAVVGVAVAAVAAVVAVVPAAVVAAGGEVVAPQSWLFNGLFTHLAVVPVAVVPAVMAAGVDGRRQVAVDPAAVDPATTTAVAVGHRAEDVDPAAVDTAVVAIATAVDADPAAAEDPAVELLLLSSNLSTPLAVDLEAVDLEDTAAAVAGPPAEAVDPEAAVDPATTA